LLDVLKQLSLLGLLEEALALQNPNWIKSFGADWGTFSHLYQREPLIDWRTWLILGGRGAGKTRAGAEWVRDVARDGQARIALVGETEHDVREVMIEGVSGVLAVHADDKRPQWIPTRRRLEWSNGAVAEAFSAEQPDSLRGPQFSHAWCDELAKWRQAEAAFDNLQFALRLGTRPRQLVTTTPRPISLLKRLIGDGSTMVTRATTSDNARNLSAAFIDHVQAR
jgi:phage terminase large subunit-like protein